MPAGDATRVIMAEILVLILDGADDIALHDLHVVDVVEELEMGRTDFLADLDTPRGMVAHVIAVINLAVEQFHADGDVVLLGEGGDALDTLRAILDAGFVVEANAIAGETNDVRT